VLVGLEVATLTFIALYLAVGAVAAAIVAAVGGNSALQFLVFAIVSIVSLVTTRGWLRRTLDRNPAVTSNAPTVVGKRGVLTVGILAGPGQRGQVRVGTEFWSATSADESAIAEGTTVHVNELVGVSLVVQDAGE
jgi:membrane protein implicated in regulation of membrane protease activity